MLSEGVPDVTVVSGPWILQVVCGTPPGGGWPSGGVGQVRVVDAATVGPVRLIRPCTLLGWLPSPAG